MFGLNRWLDCAKAGVPVYNSIEHAVQVLKALNERGAYIASNQRAELAQSLSPDAGVVATFKQAQRSGRDLFEFEAKSLLRTYGVDVPKELIVRNEAEFLEAVAEFGHTSLAMKVVSKDILHKSDAGGVKLNLSGEADLRRGHAEILAACKLYKADAEIEGVLLAPMGS